MYSDFTFIAIQWPLAKVAKISTSKYQHRIYSNTLIDRTQILKYSPIKQSILIISIVDF